MKTRNEKHTEGEARLKALHCPRTARQLEVREHEECPYCHGDGALIRRGYRAEFCNFRPGVDAVRFGFPAGTSRDRLG